MQMSVCMEEQRDMTKLIATEQTGEIREYLL
jgi:hypothetical protein